MQSWSRQVGNSKGLSAAPPLSTAQPLLPYEPPFATGASDATTRSRENPPLSHSAPRPTTSIRPHKRRNLPIRRQQRILLPLIQIHHQIHQIPHNILPNPPHQLHSLDRFSRKLRCVNMMKSASLLASSRIVDAVSSIVCIRFVFLNFLTLNLSRAYSQ